MTIYKKAGFQTEENRRSALLFSILRFLKSSNIVEIAIFNFDSATKSRLKRLEKYLIFVKKGGESKYPCKTYKYNTKIFTEYDNYPHIFKYVADEIFFDVFEEIIFQILPKSTILIRRKSENEKKSTLQLVDFKRDRIKKGSIYICDNGLNVFGYFDSELISVLKSKGFKNKVELNKLRLPSAKNVYIREVD